MIRRVGSRWELYPHKVRYTNSLNGDEIDITRPATPSMEWWSELENSNDHITIHEFSEVDVTEEMMLRFEDIEYMPDDYDELYESYIMTGDILTQDDFDLPVNHPFQFIRIKHDQITQDEYIIELDFRQLLIEMEVNLDDL